jgi:hypothetical protein
LTRKKTQEHIEEVMLDTLLGIRMDKKLHQHEGYREATLAARFAFSTQQKIASARRSGNWLYSRRKVVIITCWRFLMVYFEFLLPTAIPGLFAVAIPLA